MQKYTLQLTSSKQSNTFLCRTFWREKIRFFDNQDVFFFSSTWIVNFVKNVTNKYHTTQLQDFFLRLFLSSVSKSHPVRLEFRVKFYVRNPSQLQDEYTRWDSSCQVFDLWQCFPRLKEQWTLPQGSCLLKLPISVRSYCFGQLLKPFTVKFFFLSYLALYMTCGGLIGILTRFYSFFFCFLFFQISVFSANQKGHIEKKVSQLIFKHLKFGF